MPVADIAEVPEALADDAIVVLSAAAQDRKSGAYATPQGMGLAQTSRPPAPSATEAS